MTIRARFEGDPRPDKAVEIAAPAIEPAQPVFADYWRHNKGTAPIGYQPVSVQIRPSRLEATGPFDLPISVASGGPTRPSRVPSSSTCRPGGMPHRRRSDIASSQVAIWRSR